MVYVVAVFLPLFGAFIAGFFGRQLGDRGAQLITAASVGIAAVLSISILMMTVQSGEIRTVPLLLWLQSGALEVTWALRFDTLTAVMLVVVTGVSFMVHVYAIGYMHHDPSIPRFMSYLSLFTFFMLMLVTADNLVQLFFGWEGVGLASYLLIGFWHDRPSANAAAIKAFVVNRVGDFGFTLGILATFLLFGSVCFDPIFAAAAAHAENHVIFLGIEWHSLTVICLLLFIGAMGKSAQLGLHTWLPDAMEGPTPVSALIHAATMVTAGVFMVARMSPLFEYSPIALGVVAVVGASTAFFAATVACVQSDIKRVIAYSTCSQLGYMFFAIGVSAYQAAIFHLMTHAFFKALLFLSAGSVIHAMSGEQDMHRMGGIAGKIKITYVMMWIGSLALAGMPFFAGYYSKDIILESAFGSGSLVGRFAFWMGITAAFMTAFYSWRLLFMTFHGQPRADEKVMAHIHEAPVVMLIPLFFLAVGALFSGWISYEAFVGHHREAFWGQAIVVLPGHDAIAAAHHIPSWVKLAPFVVGASGIALAYLLYARMPVLPGLLASIFHRLYKFLLKKWYFDELYDSLFVRPAFRIGRGFWKGGDGAVIDGIGPDGVAAASRDIARRLSRLQSGYVYHYAFAMIVGVTVFVTWFVVFHIG
ncbi:NADH-ubiquinone oxidoreductase chain L [invertebrate metagenome]|uniref:NADH-ubiquinone oxidoreductase chain L n=1 Tax=invertebrate metagenome TaxID=1711999 RepID=A0A484H4C2_9ZZZZ